MERPAGGEKPDERKETRSRRVAGKLEGEGEGRRVLRDFFSRRKLRLGEMEIHGK